MSTNTWQESFLSHWKGEFTKHQQKPCFPLEHGPLKNVAPRPRWLIDALDIDKNLPHEADDPNETETTVATILKMLAFICETNKPKHIVHSADESHLKKMSDNIASLPRPCPTSVTTDLNYKWRLFAHTVLTPLANRDIGKQCESLTHFSAHLVKQELDYQTQYARSIIRELVPTYPNTDELQDELCSKMLNRLNEDSTRCPCLNNIRISLSQSEEDRDSRPTKQQIARHRRCETAHSFHGYLNKLQNDSDFARLNGFLRVAVNGSMELLDFRGERSNDDNGTRRRYKMNSFQEGLLFNLLQEMSEVPKLDYVYRLEMPPVVSERDCHGHFRMRILTTRDRKDLQEVKYYQCKPLANGNGDNCELCWVPIGYAASLPGRKCSQCQGRISSKESTGYRKLELTSESKRRPTKKWWN